MFTFTRMRQGLCAAAALLWLAHPAFGAAADETNGRLQVKQHNGIAYISGGVGDEEQDALNQMKGRFNLELTLATSTGKYVGATALQIEDQSGTPVLDIRTEGPIFMAKLPAGTYRIHASVEGETMHQTVTVPGTGMKQLTLTWPAASGSRAGDAPE